MGGDEHRDSIVRLYNKIARVPFDWNNLPAGWQEFAEGVMFVDNAEGDKKGPGGTHYRKKTNRTQGWSWPDLNDAYSELRVGINDKNKFRRYGIIFHLFVDYRYLSGDLPAEYPRIRDNASGVDIVYFHGKAFKTEVFKKEILYPSYAAHQRLDESKMEECLLHMPDEFTTVGRFVGTKANWKETVRSYYSTHSTLCSDEELAFTPEELEEFTENAVTAFCDEYPEIITELQSLTA